MREEAGACSFPGNEVRVSARDELSYLGSFCWL